MKYGGGLKALCSQLQLVFVGTAAFLQVQAVPHITDHRHDPYM